MRVELRSMKYLTELLLPADRYEIQDALDKLRLYDSSEVRCRILACGAVPMLKGMDFEDDLYRINLLAERISGSEDYLLSPTVENTSELIAAIIERNADVIGNRQNFVGYMAMRPGAEKRGTHGLFNDKDDPIVLNQVAEEVANHPGNIWSHVVSLRREDAVRLGFDNSDRWRELVKNHIDVIAESTNIKLSNLKWYEEWLEKRSYYEALRMER